MVAARKSIFALKKINKGEKFTVDNICIKRPEMGYLQVNGLEL